MDSRLWIVIILCVGLILIAMGLLVRALFAARRGNEMKQTSDAPMLCDPRILAMQEFGQLPTTGILEVDRLVYRKDCLCKEKGIDCCWRIGLIPENILSRRDLTSLLGNLLDNAIEAAEKKGKWIRVEAKVRRGNWVLFVENSKLSEEAPLRNDLETTKEDREQHGLGSGIVDDIIRSSDGYIKRRDEGDRFKVFAAIPVK